MKTIFDVSRRLAPEDIRPGRYIAIVTTVIEHMPCSLFGDPYQEPRIAPVRSVWTTGDGTPLKVEAVCLPFVLVSDPKGEHSTIDVRTHGIAALSDRYADKAVKRLGRASLKVRCAVETD